MAKVIIDPILLAQRKVIFGFLVIAAAQAYIISKVDVVGDCWIWKGSGDGRYGHAYFLGRRFKAHVLAYLAFVGVPRRHHVIDHEHCSQTKCAHWRHLRAVTQSWNIKRAYMIGNVKPPGSKGYTKTEEE